MIKNILVTLVLLIGLSGLGNAATICYLDGDLEGVYEYTTVAPYYSVVYASNHSFYWKTYIIKDTGVSTRFLRGSLHAGTCNPDTTTGSTYHCAGQPNCTLEGYLSGTGMSAALHLQGGAGYSMVGTLIISYTPYTTYTVSGTTDCISETKLYINDSGNYKLTEKDITGSYSFELLDTYSYRLTFDDGNTYDFTCNGSNINYNFDGCSHTKYRFEESCGNLIPDSEGYYLEWNPMGWWNMETYFEASDGILDIPNSSTTKMSIYTNTFVGQKWWYITPVLNNHTYNVINTALDWKLKVIVQNESDGTLIDDAMVRVNQTCYCTHEGCIINLDQSCTCGGHSTRQKKTVSGTVGFSDMSLQDASLFVKKTGYKILDESTTGYSAFLSGRSNFSSKTWIVKLANSSSNNSSTFYEVPNKVDIHFRDVTGNLTSKILDTDAHVDLYYQNNNTEEEAMTLRFESSSTHTYFMPERTYTIAHDDAGYKRITNGYFTPWDYSYRAVIYNSSIYGWNITIPLTVRNGTREEEQHYQNLTTGLWFMYTDDGKIDYREDMKVAIHAGSNNSTLLNIDVELWKDGVYIACKNLTATDFTGADFPYYYVWNPVFDYVSGSNYSVKMYGYDRTLLETDYVVCETDDTTRKNKLTIGVKDRAGGNLNNCYIYLEDWGSLPTGSTYYNAYEGIDNGDYRYKATKAGYSGGGWEKVTLTDKDKIVWYVLSEDYTNTSIAAQKFTDDDIKGFFFPLMFFLLICIVLGGLKYVAS